MAIITSNSLSATTTKQAEQSRGAVGLTSFWRAFLAKAFDPYRPELYYMRGPGPAWNAKHGAAAAFRLKSGDC
jgi:hypothetical protein